MQPAHVIAAIEVDGTLQRFGRVVPDIDALCERLGALRSQTGRLELCLVRFGVKDEATLVADLEWLEVAARYQALGYQFHGLASAADLQRLGKRTLLLAGCVDSALAANEQGIPAYLVSDRRLRDHRHLYIAELDRVIAEALRIPVPRPMSDASRKGSLLATGAGSPSEVRKAGRSLLLQDPRADWTTLGARHIVYTESESLKAQLTAKGAESLESDINLGAVGLCVGDDGARALCISKPGMIPWSRIRRARIGQSSGLENQRQPGVADSDVMVRKFTVGAQSQGFDGVLAPSFMVPFEDDEAESIIAIVEEGKSLQLAAGLANALRRCGESAAMLLCSAPATFDTLLWEQDENRLSIVITVRIGSPRAERTSQIGPPGEPVTVAIDVPSIEPAALEQAARNLIALARETTSALG